MSNLGKAAAASFDIIIGGKSYALSPLTLGDLGQYCDYVQFRDYHHLEKLAGTNPRATKSLDACFDECRKKEVFIGSTEFVKVLQTPDGLALTVSLSLRSKHPEMTPEKIASELNMEELKRLSEVVGEISGLISPDDDKPKNAQAATVNLKPLAASTSANSIAS